MKTLTTKEQEQVTSLESMIRSCFSYQSATRDSYNFDRYILPYKAKMSDTLFEDTYKAYLLDLETNYTIERGIYTDHEGCTYNTLVKKDLVVS